MTLPMSLIETIRELDRQGISGREISRQLKVSRETVAKYLAIEDFSPPVPVRASHKPRVMRPVMVEFIESVLQADQGQPRKQRHTAKRIFERLVAEKDYQGSYRRVCTHVKAWRQARQSSGDGFAELVWGPGDAQVDFGEIHVKDAGGADVIQAMLVVSFPYSNARYGQVYGGQSAECVTHGLQTIFEHVGFVPRLLVFDNATGIGRRVGEQITEAELFARFRAHHGFATRFCNPYSGNEKGHVENAVGYLRRNLFVPLPIVADIQEFNRDLLTRCDGLLDQTHYRKHEELRALFATDKAAGLDLPGARFTPVRFDTRKADKDGRVTFDNNFYLLGPQYSGWEVSLGIGARTIEFFDHRGHQLACLPRCFTHTASTIASEASLLEALFTRPGAWSHSPLRPAMPTILVTALDQASYQDKRRTLKALHATSTACGFEATMNAAHHLLRAQQPLSEAVLSLLASGTGSIYQPNPDVNLAVYDTLIA